ncbi:MAG: hypothetical protein AAB719_01790 [Patescibacteria group bacterium]
MKDEFYHKDIFGAVVDASPNAPEDQEKLPLDKRGKEFNIFLLTDALGAKNKKEAWTLYQKALLAGVSPEEIFFKLFWQVKSMLIVSKVKTVSETDMKPFTYNKSKSFLKNFKQEELEQISEDLVTGFILARRGEGEIETLIEKLLLKL